MNSDDHGRILPRRVFPWTVRRGGIGCWQSSHGYRRCSLQVPRERVRQRRRLLFLHCLAMPTEADTCRKFVVPKLQAAGWDNDPHSIAEQRYFTKGRIVVRGSQAERRKGKRADYLLRFTRDFPIA